MTKAKDLALLFELRSLSAATTRLALLDYFFGQTKLARKVREQGFTTGDLGDYLNRARQEIGIPALSGRGPAQTYLWSHVVDEDAEDGVNQIFVADSGRKTERSVRHYRPQIDSWADAWRFLFAPSHQEVRDAANRGHLSEHPTVASTEGVDTYRFVPHSAPLPVLDIHHVRVVKAIKPHLDKYYRYRFPPRGDSSPDMADEYYKRVASSQVYLLVFSPDEEGSTDRSRITYIGQTTEPEVRLAQHAAGHHRQKKKKIHDAFIAFPAPHEGDLPAVEKGIAESMCINFFKEISDNDNQGEGGDTLPPDMAPVRRAAAFSTAFCAAVLLLVRKHGIDFPFHKEITGLLKRKDGAQNVVERYLNGGGLPPA